MTNARSGAPPGPSVGWRDTGVSALTIPFLIEGPSVSAGMAGELENGEVRASRSNADAAAFFDDWLARCSETGIPEKADIDPIELPRLLHAIYTGTSVLGNPGLRGEARWRAEKSEAWATSTT